VCVGRFSLKIEGKCIAESACNAPFACIVKIFYHREGVGVNGGMAGIDAQFLADGTLYFQPGLCMLSL
jgi:hypothetical protein